jgi:hypothetical protein
LAFKKHIKTLPITTNALIIRTDFSNQGAWENITAKMKHPDEPFVFNMELLDDRAYQGFAVEQLMAALPNEYPHSFMVVVDSIALSQRDQPTLVVNLLEQRGHIFRALPSQVAGIGNNLSIANMGFEEFAGAVGEDGVFRGFLEM